MSELLHAERLRKLLHEAPAAPNGKDVICLSEEYFYLNGGHSYEWVRMKWIKSPIPSYIINNYGVKLSEMELRLKNLLAPLSLPEESNQAKSIACVWTQDEDGWNTKCGNKFVINEGTPRENDMHYCCYCGGDLLEEPLNHESEDTELNAIADSRQDQKRIRVNVDDLSVDSFTVNLDALIIDGFAGPIPKQIFIDVLSMHFSGKSNLEISKTLHISLAKSRLIVFAWEADEIPSEWTNEAQIKAGGT